MMEEQLRLVLYLNFTVVMAYSMVVVQKPVMMEMK